MLYPKDPSLDPQLVWKGRDAQDSEDLAVPVVPVYMQEKIHPQAIIEDLRRDGAAKGGPRLGTGTAGFCGGAFGDFYGIGDDWERRIDVDNHDAPQKPHWSNRMILGDSLLVMTLLAEKEVLKGKVQRSYLDPPISRRLMRVWLP